MQAPRQSYSRNLSSVFFLPLRARGRAIRLPAGLRPPRRRASPGLGPGSCQLSPARGPCSWRTGSPRPRTEAAPRPGPRTPRARGARAAPERPRERPGARRGPPRRAHDVRRGPRLARLRGLRGCDVHRRGLRRLERRRRLVPAPAHSRGPRLRLGEPLGRGRPRGRAVLRLSLGRGQRPAGRPRREVHGRGRHVPGPQRRLRGRGDRLRRHGQARDRRRQRGPVSPQGHPVPRLDVLLLDLRIHDDPLLAPTDGSAFTYPSSSRSSTAPSWACRRRRCAGGDLYVAYQDGHRSRAASRSRGRPTAG